MKLSHSEVTCSVIDTPVGLLQVDCLGEAVTGIQFVKHQASTHSESGWAADVAAQLQTYFEDPQYKFELEYSLQGTPFQQRVWQLLVTIPLGSTRTYGELAAELKSSPRAVGNACRVNPCVVAVPCHRVVAANGLGGFSGATDGHKLTMKQWLLTHEGALLL